MTSFLGELRRRNVWRVGTAYAVAAWLVLQVGNLVFEAIEAPNWAMKSLLVICALGFPIALVFAWMFELTPQGVVRDSELERSPAIALDTRRKLNYTIIALLVLAVGVLSYDKFVRSVGEADVPSASTAGVARSIAVLPFVNMSEDPGNEYFSDGLSEELLNLLAKVDGLKVAARTSSFKFKGAKADIEEIGGALGVATVLEGSVRRSGDQVRITAQLINAKDGFHLWSETYDRNLDNIFQVQEEIAGAIVEALKLPLLGPKSAPIAARATKTLAAYDLYLLGRFHVRETNAASFGKAIDYFKAVIEADPSYAPAYSGLSDAYAGMTEYGDMPPMEGLAAAEQAAKKALELDPGLAEAWTSMGSILLVKGRVEESLAALRKAVAINPNSAPAWMTLAQVLTSVGRFQEAVSASERAVELDRMSDLIRQQHILYLVAAGRGEEARKLGLEWTAAEPQNAFAHEGLGGAYRALGQLDLAVIELARAHDLRPGDAYMARRISESFVTMHDVPSAKRWLEEASKRAPRASNTAFAAFTIAWAEGDTKTQLALVGQILSADSNSVIGLSGLGQIQLRSGQLEAAEATLKRVLDLRDDRADGPLAYASIGAAMGLACIYEQRDDAERLAPWLARLSALRDSLRAEVPNSSDASMLAAKVASLRGDRKLMLDELRAAARQGFRQDWSLRTDAAFIGWRDDLQFKEFLEEIERQNIALRARLVATKAGQALVASP